MPAVHTSYTAPQPRSTATEREHTSITIPASRLRRPSISGCVPSHTTTTMTRLCESKSGGGEVVAVPNPDASHGDRLKATADDMTQRVASVQHKIMLYNRVLMITTMIVAVCLALCIALAVVTNDTTKADIHKIQDSVSAYQTFATLVVTNYAAEGAFRAYLVTGSATDLSTYQNYTNRLMPTFTQLQSMYTSDATQMNNFVVLQPFIQSLVTTRNTAIADRQSIAAPTIEDAQRILATTTSRAKSIDHNPSQQQALQSLMRTIGVNQVQHIDQWTNEAYHALDSNLQSVSIILSISVFLVLMQGVGFIFQRHEKRKLVNELHTNLKHAKSAIQMKSSFLSSMSHELRR